MFFYTLYTLLWRFRQSYNRGHYRTPTQTSCTMKAKSLKFTIQFHPICDIYHTISLYCLGKSPKMTFATFAAQVDSSLSKVEGGKNRKKCTFFTHVKLHGFIAPFLGDIICMAIWAEEETFLEIPLDPLGDNAFFCQITLTHLANGPWKKSLNFIFPTKYVTPKSLKFSHWPSKLNKPYTITVWNIFLLTIFLNHQLTFPIMSHATQVTDESLERSVAMTSNSIRSTRKLPLLSQDAEKNCGPTLLETNNSHLKMDPIFRGYVSFREGKIQQVSFVFSQEWGVFLHVYLDAEGNLRLNFERHRGWENNIASILAKTTSPTHFWVFLFRFVNETWSNLTK